MNSSIYTAQIGHWRTKPQKNGFTFSSFFIYLDLDEVEELDRTMPLFSYNRWNIFSFCDADHFTFTRENSPEHDVIASENVKFTKEKYLHKTTKEKVKIMIEELGLGFQVGKVYLLTNLRNRGYVFNPVSFYYCFDIDGKFRVLFSEVNNTFHQQKMYYSVISDPTQKRFHDKQPKNYYVSPFIDYDTSLVWEFEIPDERLIMLIDSVRDTTKELRTSVVGKKIELSNKTLWWLLLRYPFLTLMIIGYIHYQALKLWLKKVKIYSKRKTDQRIVSTLTKN